MITLAGTTVSVMNEVIIPYFPVSLCALLQLMGCTICLMDLASNCKPYPINLTVSKSAKCLDLTLYTLPNQHYLSPALMLH